MLHMSWFYLKGSILLKYAEYARPEVLEILI